MNRDGNTLRRLSALAGLVAALAVAALPVSAGAVIYRAPNGKTFGVYFAQTHAGQAARRAAEHASGSPSARGHARTSPVGKRGKAGSDLLQYYGGPLMTTAPLRIRAIFWGSPGSFASGPDHSYEDAVVQYLRNVAADSGKVTNDYSVVSQYTDGNGATGSPVTDHLELASVLNDTTDYGSVPPGADRSCAGVTNCVTDGQVRDEIEADIDAQGWPRNPAASPQDLYAVFLPPGVEQCASPGVCANNVYCAYHDEIDIGGTASPYAIMPFTDLQSCWNGSAPGDLNPNASNVIESLTHEVIEAATDPEPYSGTGWVTSSFSEIGDLCHTAHGPALGEMDGGLFNQLISGQPYEIQQMWSNAPAAGGTDITGCVGRSGPTPQMNAPAVATTGSRQSFHGGGSFDVEGPITRYSWDFGDGTPVETGNKAHASHTYADPGSYDLRLTVADATGPSSSSTQIQGIGVTGPSVCVVPRVRGERPARAEVALVSLNCKPGVVERRPSGRVAPGHIISSKPGAGAVRADGAKVALAVSTGPGQGR